MSNGGIYILHTPGDAPGEFEYRVMHLYDVNEIWGKLPNGKIDYDLVSGESVVSLFGKTTVYKDIEEAQGCAHNLYYRLEMSDPALVHDGVNAVHLFEPFSFYVATAPVAKKKAAKKTCKPAPKGRKANETKGKKERKNK